jgi:eIF-2B alpha/beta/delta-like uncharacterized protein
MIIAIDGTSASGKTTLARRLAARLGYLYFDTGVMYRALTLAALRQGLSMSDEPALSSLAAGITIDVTSPTAPDGRPCTVLLDGEDVTWTIRSPEVDASVSQASIYPGVRTALTLKQRRIGLRGRVVMVGRDIGTVVLPEAELKFFVTASIEERARRRLAELTLLGEIVGLAEVERSLAMARHGARLLPQNATVLTICNTGALAGPGMGTALGVVFQAHMDGKRPHVYACETRPLLQGSRLTTLELQRAKIPVTLIADSAAASVVDRCDLVLVGADRIAANGDTANKVGTRMLATLARAAHKPFYVVAPSSTFDAATRTGKQIVVEERDGEEVRAFAGCRAAPAGTAVFNPAFDVTPARLITGFITERGILNPTYRKSIQRLLSR